MKRWIEKEFQYRGLKCICIALDAGWRCGYVGVPINHQLYKTDYMDLGNIEVHGGLTFSGFGNATEFDKDLWWFGFDCAHFDDKLDVEIMSEEAKRCNIFILDMPGEVRDLNYMENQCRNLVQQLLEVK